MTILNILIFFTFTYVLYVRVCVHAVAHMWKSKDSVVRGL